MATSERHIPAKLSDIHGTRGAKSISYNERRVCVLGCRGLYFRDIFGTLRCSAAAHCASVVGLFGQEILTAHFFVTMPDYLIKNTC